MEHQRKLVCNMLTKTGCTSVSSWAVYITVILIPADYEETLHSQVNELYI